MAIRILLFITSFLAGMLYFSHQAHVHTVSGLLGVIAYEAALKNEARNRLYETVLELEQTKAKLAQSEEAMILLWLRPPPKEKINKPKRIWASTKPTLLKSRLYDPMVKRVQQVNPKAPAEQVVNAILNCSAEYHINPLYVMAVIERESHYNPKAIGKLGERGLMQLMRSTAKTLGVEWQHAFDIETNVCGGTKYLAQHLTKYQDWRHALTRYNGSPIYAERVMEKCSHIWTSVYETLAEEATQAA